MLGKRCVHCGATDGLTFDCIKPKGQFHHKMSSARRISFYFLQARQGNLQVLCFDCNVVKSNKPNPVYVVVQNPLGRKSKSPDLCEPQKLGSGDV
jgi:hypothetical protein